MFSKIIFAAAESFSVIESVSMATGVAWSYVVVPSWWPPSESRSLNPSRRTKQCHLAPASSELSESSAPPDGDTWKHQSNFTIKPLFLLFHTNLLLFSQFLAEKQLCRTRTYLVVDTVEVSIETLVEPPASVADLSTDVACVWCAETLQVMIPAERILRCPAETGHMQAVLVVLILDSAARGKWSNQNYSRLADDLLLLYCAKQLLLFIIR